VNDALQRVAALARNTFREAIRDKILYSLLFFALVMILSAVVLGQLSLHEEGRIVRDMGLSGISFFSVIIAIFIGISLVSKELDRKTVLSIVPKPMHRHEFVLGKFFGMALVLLVQVVIMSVVLGIVCAIEDAPPDAALAKSIVLLYTEVLVITAVALLFSSFSTPYLSGLFTFGIFVVGRSTPELLAVAKKMGDAGTVIRAVAAIVPDLHLFFVSGSLMGGQHVSVHGDYVGWPYVVSTCVYGVTYTALLLLAASLIFRRRDFV
jgi:ABC-type transport system involved in multi-copper enzyme maturation permease subunit